MFSFFKNLIMKPAEPDYSALTRSPYEIEAVGGRYFIFNSNDMVVGNDSGYARRRDAQRGLDRLVARHTQSSEVRHLVAA